MVGKTLGHYRIVEKIGAGGMGEVYRARDERLDRDVAVKVLPAGTLADAQARKRFRKEALALSKLNHPNVQTIHDFDTQDGVDFLVTEYVPGVTLSDRLAGKRLPEKEVLRLGQQLAEGLAAAHEQGIIHRDLKPSNLRVTPDGRLKILDFGVAKLARPSSATATTQTLTETQSAAGTPLYMAPEQIRGGRIGPRTDIYSLGAVLYEMATGRRPFPETQSGQLMDAILHQAPAAPAGVPAELQRLILKCLEKDPAKRYQSAEAVAAELNRLAAPAPAAEVSPRQGPRGSVWWALWLGVIAVVVVALGVGGYFGWERWRERVQAPSGEPGPITSIAVLPFADLAGDPEQEYFVDGMTEALITELSKISALRVISRTSVMQYKDVKKPLPEIARELNVDAVVEGSVLRAGDRVRITAQLVHAPTDTHLWAESYDRELRDILALHSEVARAIAREVKVTVTPEEETRLAAARAVNPEAHELYLRGRYHWHKRGREGLEKSLQYFQQAIEKDPGYARAYAGLADVYAVRPSWGFAAPTDDFPRARAAARKALELDENLAQPYATLGQVKDSYDRDWRGAEEDCRRALELDPNYATGHHWYGILLSTLGRHEEAIAELETAVRLDPLAPNISRWLGRVLYHARRYDEAVQQLQKTVEMHPDFSGAFLDLGTAYAQMGRYPEALAAMEKSRGLSEADPLYAYAGWIYARTGRKEEAQRLLRRLQELSGQQYVDSSAIAIIYIGLGRKEEALTWLERAYEERGAYRILYLKVDPVFDPLREEPRFQELLRRLNFPE